MREFCFLVMLSGYLLIPAGCGKSPQVAGVYTLEERMGQNCEQATLDLRSDGAASWRLITQTGDGTGEVDSSVIVMQSRGNWRWESGGVVYRAPESSVTLGTLEPARINIEHVLVFSVEPNGDLIRDDMERTRLIKQR
jgi:hypothetical protein